MDVTQRFLDYVRFHTTSDDASTSCPSTPGQLTLADHLVQELLQAASPTPPAMKTVMSMATFLPPPAARAAR